MRDYEGRNYINGEWLKPSEHTYSKINPSTGKLFTPEEVGL